MKKRAIAASLTVVLAMGTAAPVLPSARGFSDVYAGHWAAESIRTAAGKSIISGYKDGSFRPGQSVTNAQFAVMLARAFYPDEMRAYEDQGYDGGPAPWYWSAVSALRDHGVLEGTAMGSDGGWPVLGCGGSFVTRYDMAQLAYHIMLDFEQSGSEVEREIVPYIVRDWAEIPEDYRDAVTACYVLEVLQGHGSGNFDGEALMNRAQACVVIERLGRGLGVQIGTGDKVELPTGRLLTSGEPVTEENVRNLLLRVAAEWQKSIRIPDYPAGNSSSEVREAIWSYTDARGKKFSMTTGSGGYATMLSDCIFGRHGFPVRKLESVSQMRAGDIVITLQSGNIIHAAIYSGESGDMMTLDGKISTGYGTFSLRDGGTPGMMVFVPQDELPGRTYEVWTRYPE